MQKAGEKVRDIQFFSKKNNSLIMVHSEEAKAYTRYLEEMEDVVAYQTSVPWLEEKLKQIQKVDIRTDFFEQSWTTDFYLTYVNGSRGIREVIKASLLEKRAAVEKLELSRRYWASFGIADWKIVVMEGR